MYELGIIENNQKRSDITEELFIVRRKYNERTTTLNITGIKNENALYGFESLSVKLDEEGNLNIPEQIRIFQRLLVY